MAIAAAQTPDAKEYQSGVCPSEPPLEAAPGSRHWLEGSIDQKRVRMYLERGGAAVVGVLYDTEQWLPLILGGRWKEGGIVELNARSEGAPAGQLDGRMIPGGFTGSWKPQGKTAIEGGAVRLKSISQPNCGQLGGTVRRFHDPRWPVTFSYPGSWRLEAQADSLQLTCPDPSDMAYADFNIRVSQGSLANQGSQAGDFMRCAGTWRYGSSCDCDHLAATCEVAEVNHSDGITILAGDEQEWRVYCRNGGYVALGSGSDRLLLIDNLWVEFKGQGPPSELIGEIVKTVRRRP
ncbi:MAG TPA: hypothetical protein VMI94_07985 [Bryobacteraceae bacterium]|nr:hypothetical protein [Bryobacteraceae bacterium]